MIVICVRFSGRLSAALGYYWVCSTAGKANRGSRFNVQYLVLSMTNGKKGCRIGYACRSSNFEWVVVGRETWRRASDSDKTFLFD